VAAGGGVNVEPMLAGQWLGTVRTLPQAETLGAGGARVTLATLGSHSALEICRGARAYGLPTLVVAERGRERTYAEYFRASGGEGCVDEVLLVDRFAELLSDRVQDELRRAGAIWVPHRSFEVYLGRDYDAIENSFDVRMFGNRRLLRIEERELHPNQYDLLRAAGIPHPRLFAAADDIDRPVLVKVLEQERGFERAFFVARDRDDYMRQAEQGLAAGVFTAGALAAATIEEFVLGAQVNLNFFYSPLRQRLELLGTDTRRQTNSAGLAALPGTLHEAVLRAVALKHEEAGHIAVTVLESMLERAFELGERFVTAAAAATPPGVIGPFALQCFVVPGPPKKDFVVVDVSPRMPGSPGIAATPYTQYLFGRPVSAGERIAMEIADALEAGSLESVIT
jgi:5-formaminoimidazole-4-carboxamide-1-(beta)-D-ribofuranosyl 5'-monophosphate synthetase